MEQNQQGQAPLNVNEEEMDLIKSVFGGNEELLKSMRAIAFNLDVTDEDRAVVADAMKDDRLFAVVERRILPSLDRETPIGQVQDAWLGVESMVFGASADTISQSIQYKVVAMELTQAFLDSIRDASTDLAFREYDPLVDDTLAIQLLGRNQYIRHIESQLMFLWMIAEMERPTDKQKAVKNAKNSTQ